MRSLWSSCLALLLCACGAANTGAAPIGASLATPIDPPRPMPAPKPIVPDDVVARAAQAFHAQRNADSRELNATQLSDELSHFDALCLGEAHDQARDHYAELALVEALERRARVSGRELGIGFEMFQAPYNDALRAYGLGRLNDAGLRKKTHYDDRWGFAYAYYRPLLGFGRDYGLPLEALNAPRELTHAVAEKGLAGLTPKERRKLPELDMDDSAHRASFERMMASHPRGADLDLDKYYAAQVVWDETMADRAARWLQAHAPSRQLVVLAGSAHCRLEAIPARIVRRAPMRVASVRLGANAPEDSDGYDYTLVFDGG